MMQKMHELYQFCHLSFMQSNFIWHSAPQSQPLLSPSWSGATDGASGSPEPTSIKLPAARLVAKRVKAATGPVTSSTPPFQIPIALNRVAPTLSLPAK